MLTVTTPMAPPPRSARRLYLHPGQREPYDAPARFKVIAAGRRWGKSSLALVALLSACLRRPGTYRYVAPTSVIARKTFWRRVRRAVDPSWLARPPHETHLEVEFRTGSVLEVMGADNPDGLRGAGVHGIVLDEYADMRAEVWEEAVRPSLSDTGGWALFVGTPKSHNHFYRLYQRGHDPEHPAWAAWQFRSIDNPLLDPADIEEARRTLDPRSFRQEYEASFEAIAGRAYYAFSRAEHVGPVSLDLALPVCIGFDFNVHPATAVLGQQRGPDVTIWREVWVPYAGGEATRAAATTARLLLAQARWAGPIRLYGDPAGQAAKTTGPSDHAVLREVFPGAVWCIPRQAPHVRDRVAAVNSRLRTMDGQIHLRIDPSCRHLLDDLDQVVFLPNGDLDKRTDPLRTHVSDALGYWLAEAFPATPAVQLAVWRVPREAGAHGGTWVRG